MNKTLNEIAGFIGGTVLGDGAVLITGLKGIKEAACGDLSFHMAHSPRNITAGMAPISPRRIPIKTLRARMNGPPNMLSNTAPNAADQPCHSVANSAVLEVTS